MAVVRIIKPKSTYAAFRSWYFVEQKLHFKVSTVPPTQNVSPTLTTMRVSFMTSRVIQTRNVFMAFQTATPDIFAMMTTS